MRDRGYTGRIIGSVCVALMLGVMVSEARQAPLVVGQAKIEPVVSADLAEVGLAGTGAAMRVTIAPGVMTADHTHTGRTSIVIMVQGALTEVRGTAKRDYKAGDVFTVAEGVTHHAENPGTAPVTYIEINISAKKK